MILLVNGPNLNLLGEREPETYGATTLPEIEKMVEEACAAYGQPVKAIQSNYEGALLDFLHENRHEAKGVIVNPGALSHTSYALHDCLKALPCPAVEVHISNVHAREEWRRRDLVAPATRGQVVGLGPTGYYFAAVWLCSQLVAQPAEAVEAAEGEAMEVPPTDLEPVVGGDYEG
ncbi:MAG TPA: type II 3-dehydroquinate dehydratase [Anaeromyxobacteraceae bacterium]|nr:type II 3-dehydroquinate dehydratase [Anaeromyxobacteraceae bacterium]